MMTRNYYEESKSLVDMIHEHSNYVNVQWNIYSVILIGLVGFVLTNTVIKSKGKLGALLCMFLFFALTNAGVVYRNQNVVYTAYEQLSMILSVKSFQSEYPGWVETLKTLSPTNAWLVTGFHLVLDFTIVIVLWVIGRNKRDTVTS